MKGFHGGVSWRGFMGFMEGSLWVASLPPWGEGYRAPDKQNSVYYLINNTEYGNLAMNHVMN
jgi:hypothetical protein